MFIVDYTEVYIGAIDVIDIEMDWELMEAEIELDDYDLELDDFEFDPGPRATVNREKYHYTPRLCHKLTSYDSSASVSAI